MSSGLNCLAVSLFLWAAAPLFADDAEAKAVAAVEKLGGTVTYAPQNTTAVANDLRRPDLV